MANRYGRDIGRNDRDRDRPGGGDHGRRSSYGRSGGSGSSSFGDDERYFGGGRQIGEGYSGGSRFEDERYERDYGGTGSDYSENYGGRERYRQGSEYSQGYGGGEYGRGRSTNLPSRYSGRGGGEYGNYGSPRFEDRFGGQGAEDVGQHRSNYGSGYSNYGSNYGSGYGSGYQSSERNYGRDRDQGDDRGWWDKTSDEVASWFGDEDAARRRQMDARMSGGHRGRGPSGYTRSDDRIKEDINDRLTDYDYIDASNISVDVQGGDVTLTGTVGGRYEKRLAEDIAEDISGVKNVENRLRVSSTGSMSTTGTTGTTGTTASEMTSAGTSTSGTTGTGTGDMSTGSTQARGKSSSGS